MTVTPEWPGRENAPRTGPASEGEAASTQSPMDVMGLELGYSRPASRAKRRRAGPAGVIITVLAAAVAGTWAIALHAGRELPPDVVAAPGAGLGYLTGGGLFVAMVMMVIASVLARLIAKTWLGPAGFVVIGVAAILGALLGGLPGLNGAAGQPDRARISAALDELKASVKHYEGVARAGQAVEPFVPSGRTDPMSRILDVAEHTYHDEAVAAVAFQNTCKATGLEAASRPAALVSAAGVARARAALARCRDALVKTQETITVLLDGLPGSVSALDIDPETSEAVVAGIQKDVDSERERMQSSWVAELQLIDARDDQLRFIGATLGHWQWRGATLMFTRQADLNRFRALAARIRAAQDRIETMDAESDRRLDTAIAEGKARIGGP